MNFKEMQERIHAGNVARGFWEEERNVGEVLALIHSEVSEALEAHRHGRKYNEDAEELPILPAEQAKVLYEEKVKGSFEEEMADIVIRVMDFCQGKGIDLQWHIQQKVRYNESRPYKHGKAY